MNFGNASILIKIMNVKRLALWLKNSADNLDGTGTRRDSMKAKTEGSELLLFQLATTLFYILLDRNRLTRRKLIASGCLSGFDCCTR